MSTVMIKVSKHKTEELKEMIEEGLRIFGRAMSVAEQMCEESEMGERYGERYGYGERVGLRDSMGGRADMRDDYMGERMGMRDGGGYGERRGRSASTGRYTSY